MRGDRLPSPPTICGPVGNVIEIDQILQEILLGVITRHGVSDIEKKSQSIKDLIKKLRPLGALHTLLGSC